MTRWDICDGSLNPKQPFVRPGTTALGFPLTPSLLKELVSLLGALLTARWGVSVTANSLVLHTNFLEPAQSPQVKGSVPRGCPTSHTNCRSQASVLLANRLQIRGSHDPCPASGSMIC